MMTWITFQFSPSSIPLISTASIPFPIISSRSGTLSPTFPYIPPHFLYIPLSSLSSPWYNRQSSVCIGKLNPSEHNWAGLLWSLSELIRSRAGKSKTLLNLWSWLSSLVTHQLAYLYLQANQWWSFLTETTSFNHQTWQHVQPNG